MRLARIAALVASVTGAAIVTRSPAFAARPKNVVVILSDDHRYDFIGVEDGPEFLETPHLDRMAKEGAWFRNSFVVTSLCSPSRATILTGNATHRHGVIDNQRPVPVGTRFFPQDLQAAGYHTAFVGKWHMGHESDEPRPGFHHWVSFKGQGTYFDPELNVNGAREAREGYTTDVLTDLATEWLAGRRGVEEPFYLHLAFKAVHYPFQPAPRHHGRYENAPIPYPETMANTEENYESQPHWVRERRYGIHGIDHMETGAFDNDPVPSFDDLYHRYAETVHGLDENIGRVLRTLEETGLAKDTLVIYTSDNGFALGEHGFYDKRDAYEISIRVPLLAWAPGWLTTPREIREMVLNTDIAPSVLDILGARTADGRTMDGRSFVPLLEGRTPETPWRTHFVYSYYWEWNFPATPTLFAICTDRYKFIHAHGVWDRDAFFDLATDPVERHNLIRVPAFAEEIERLRTQLFDEIDAQGMTAIPFRRPLGEQFYDRKLRR